jgi:hypothetical protein
MRKKSENRSNIIIPLHFGHSIDPSQVATCTAESPTKQKLHQIVIVPFFKRLRAKYFFGEEKTAGRLGTKTFEVSFFCSFAIVL